MNRNFRILAASLAVVALASAAWTECVCAKAKSSGEGWCGDCKAGYVFGQKLSSKKVYDAMQGKALSADEIKKCECSKCKDAYAKDGACDACHVKFVSHKMYSSNIAACLAVGTPVTKDTEMCAKCKESCTKNGMEKMAEMTAWCDGCKAGFAAGRKYSTKEAYEAAKHAIGVVRNAVQAAGKCEGCAVAMVSDGKCDECKVSFKNGELVKAKP